MNSDCPPKKFKRATGLGLLALAVSQLCFVGWLPDGTDRSFRSRIPRQMRPELKKRALHQKQTLNKDRAIVAKQKFLTSQMIACKSADAVLKVIHGGDLPMAELSEINYVTCIHMIAKLHKTANSTSLTSQRPFQEILEQSCACLRRPDVQARSVANWLWAIATTRDSIPELKSLLTPAIQAISRQKVQRMNQQEVFNTLWAEATLYTYCPGLRSDLDIKRVSDLVVSHVMDIEEDLNIQNLAYGLWSVARMPPSISSLREKLLPFLLSCCQRLLENEDRVELDARFFKAAIARLVWSLSLLDCKDQAILDRALYIFLKETSDRGLLPHIDMVCAYAKLGITKEDLLKTTAELPWKLSTLRNWDICAMTFAYQELDPHQQYAGFQAKLRAEVERRHLSQQQVIQSQYGYEEWN